MSGAFAFDQPFQEAVDYFLSKGIVSRAEFEALSWDQRAKAFTAAYVHGADELQRVYDAVLSALEKGTTLADFKKFVGNILDKPWHRETVFRTNVLSAYGRGHWEQAQATKELRPYARYSAVMDGRTRPRHAALHGLVFPLDSPFWQLYWPPWDYNCRCAAITLSPGEIEAQGLKVSSELPNVPVKNDFQSPARGGEWQPDLAKYHPDLAEDLVRSLQGRPAGAGAGAPNLGNYSPGDSARRYAGQTRVAREDLGLPPEWRPVMTKKDALAFIEESQIKQDLYFVTDKKTAAALKKEGFNPVVGAAEVKYFGDGVYLERTASAAPGSMQGVAKAKLTNPYRHDWNGDGGQALTSFRGPLGKELRALVDANPGMTRTAAVTKILTGQGYDGIIASAQGKPLVVVFDKTQAVITKLAEVKPATVKGPQGEFIRFDSKADGHNWALRSNYASWSNQISQAEKDALTAYKGSQYMDINRFLRFGEQSRSYGKKVDGWVNNLDQALEKHPIPANLTVYRGSSYKFFGGKVSRDDLPRFVGAVFEDKGYPSCGIANDAAWSHKGVVLEIHCPKGTPGCYLDAVWNRGEYEILLKRGLRYRVTGVDTSAGAPRVSLEVLTTQ